MKRARSTRYRRVQARKDGAPRPAAARLGGVNVGIESKTHTYTVEWNHFSSADLSIES